MYAKLVEREHDMSNIPIAYVILLSFAPSAAAGGQCGRARLSSEIYGERHRFFFSVAYGTSFAIFMLGDA